MPGVSAFHLNGASLRRSSPCDRRPGCDRSVRQALTLGAVHQRHLAGAGAKLSADPTLRTAMLIVTSRRPRTFFPPWDHRARQGYGVDLIDRQHGEPSRSAFRLVACVRKFSSCETTSSSGFYKSYRSFRRGKSSGSCLILVLRASTVALGSSHSETQTSLPAARANNTAPTHFSSGLKSQIP